MSAVQAVARPSGFASERDGLRPCEAPANDNGLQQELVAPRRNPLQEWLVLGLIATGGVLTIGWTGVLGWGFWRLVASAMF